MLGERVLHAEQPEHLDRECHEVVANAGGNIRSRKDQKTHKGSFGELSIEVPRDCNSTSEPQLIPKHQTRSADFDDKIISLHALGMTVREIRSLLQDINGPEVTPSVTHAVNASPAASR